jgi:hypothetical protein
VIERTGKTKRTRWSGFAVAAGLLAAVAIGLSWPRERLLTSVGRAVMAVDSSRERICWQSDHQLLLLRTERFQTVFGTHGGSPETKDWHGSASLFNMDTGAKTPLSGLTDRLNRIGILPIIGPKSFTSPDGTWFLWRAYENGFRGDNSPPPRLASLDGSHFRAWPFSENETDFYLDAQHLVQLRDHEPVMTVYDLLDPTGDRTYKTLSQTKAVMAQLAAKHPSFLCVSPFCYDQSEVCAEVTTYRTPDYGQLIWAEGHEGDGSPRYVKIERLKLPGASALFQVRISRQETALLYHVQIVRSAPLRRWLHRLLPAIALTPVTMEEIWVSRPDGTGMHVIGHVPAKLDADGAVHDYNDTDEKGVLENLQWLPDGKHVSFVYTGALYVVPAEPDAP